MMTATQTSPMTSKATAARRNVGVDRVREQALTIECCVNAQREEGGGEDAKDDAADDPASACDQPQPGDGGSGDCIDNGAAEDPRLRG